jgi:5-formyltetrahydrofolate cyclo-ligase
MADRTTSIDAKVELRGRMRTLRRELADRAARSVSLWNHVRTIPEVGAARRILSYSTIVGEPDVAPFDAWCLERGIAVAVPEDVVPADWPDVVVVPGLAFTASGHRLGQGGGWYDRYLVGIRDDCLTIGVCFREQVVADVPVEAHDVVLDVVVSDAGRCR